MCVCVYIYIYIYTYIYIYILVYTGSFVTYSKFSSCKDTWSYEDCHLLGYNAIWLTAVYRRFSETPRPHNRSKHYGFSDYKSAAITVVLRLFPSFFLSFFLSFFFLSFFLPKSDIFLITRCSCGGLFLHLIILNDTHTYTLGRTPPGAGLSRRRDLYLTTQTLKRERHPRLCWKSNPLSQDTSGCRPVP